MSAGVKGLPSRHQRAHCIWHGRLAAAVDGATTDTESSLIDQDDRPCCCREICACVTCNYQFMHAGRKKALLCACSCRCSCLGHWHKLSCMLHALHETARQPFLPTWRSHCVVCLHSFQLNDCAPFLPHARCVCRQTAGTGCRKSWPLMDPPNSSKARSTMGTVLQIHTAPLKPGHVTQVQPSVPILVQRQGGLSRGDKPQTSLSGAVDSLAAAEEHWW